MINLSMLNDTYIVLRWCTFNHAVRHLHISSFLVWLYIFRPPPRCIMVRFLVFGRRQILKQIYAILWCHLNMIYQGIYYRFDELYIDIWTYYCCIVERFLSRVFTSWITSLDYPNHVGKALIWFLCENYTYKIIKNEERFSMDHQ